MATQQGGVPVMILREGSSRSKGRDVQHSNIMAAQVIAEAVRSALGPKGMDKMLVDSMGDVTITSDGRTILDQMDVEHPAAKMMIEVAKTQDDEVGDGSDPRFLGPGQDLVGLLQIDSLAEVAEHPGIAGLDPVGDQVAARPLH